MVDSNMSSSPLGISLDLYDLVLHISSWNCGTEPSVLDHVPASVQLHVVFALQRREVPSCLGSILVESLTTTLPSGCWVVCVRKCSSHACCSAIMVNCSTGSTFQKQFKLYSRLLSSHSRNVCCGWLGVLIAGVRPESVHPRTVTCRTG